MRKGEREREWEWPRKRPHSRPQGSNQTRSSSARIREAVKRAGKGYEGNGKDDSRGSNEAMQHVASYVQYDQKDWGGVR